MRYKVIVPIALLTLLIVSGVNMNYPNGGIIPEPDNPVYTN